jgi:hypothetical protein
MLAADALAAVLALCMAGLAAYFLRVYSRLALGIDRPGHSCADAAPYGVGPCGVARVTYPSLHGLVVRELPR